MKLSGVAAVALQFNKDEASKDVAGGHGVTPRASFPIKMDSCHIQLSIAPKNIKISQILTELLAKIGQKPRLSNNFWSNQP